MLSLCSSHWMAPSNFTTGCSDHKSFYTDEQKWLVYLWGEWSTIVLLDRIRHERSWRRSLSRTALLVRSDRHCIEQCRRNSFDWSEYFLRFLVELPRQMTVEMVSRRMGSPDRSFDSSTRIHSWRRDFPNSLAFERFLPDSSSILDRRERNATSSGRRSDVLVRVLGQCTAVDQWCKRETCREHECPLFGELDWPICR